MATTNYCSSGETGEVFVNGSSIGAWDGVITVEKNGVNYWDYVFTCTGASSGCKTYYTPIYRETVDTTPVWSVDFRSGQLGSCNLPVKDVRGIVSFGGGSKICRVISPSGTIPDPNNPNHIYPGSSYELNLHGNSEADALPKLFSKNAVTVWTVTVFSQGNQVFQQNYNSDPSVSVNCSGVPHDCINKACRPASQYGTPGLYKSLSECEQNCGSKGCSGKCVPNNQWAIIEGVSNNLKNQNCKQ